MEGVMAVRLGIRLDPIRLFTKEYVDTRNFREDVKKLYDKHKDLFKFSMVSEQDDDRRFYVYEWFTKDENKVFYVGRGTGNRYNHIINEDIEKPGGVWLRELRDKFGIDYRIVADKLTNAEAEVYEVCMIKERCDKGEVLLQGTDMPYDYEAHQSEIQGYKDRSFEPIIKVSNYHRRYLGLTTKASYDPVNMESLRYTHFLRSGGVVDQYTNKEKEAIYQYINALNGNVYSSLAKAARSVIEFGILDCSEYIKLKEQGFQVYHSFHVMDFIQNNKPVAGTPVQKKKPSVPKIDTAKRDEMAEYLQSIQGKINDLAANYMKRDEETRGLPKIKEVVEEGDGIVTYYRDAHFDAGYELEMKGMEFEKQKDIYNTVLYYEACLRVKFWAPYPYNRLAIIYRKYALFNDELRVLNAGIKNLKLKGGDMFDRRRKVLEILDYLPK